jgi:hypothetical protein
MKGTKKKPTLSTYAYFLKLLLLFFGIPLIIVPFIYKWILRGTYVFNEIKLEAMKTTHLNPLAANLIPPPKLKLLAIITDGISVLLLLLGCFFLIKLFSFYCLMFYRKIFLVALIWTLYNPIKSTALSIITTANNPIGNRVLSVTLKGDDLFHILIVGSLLILNSLMKEAYKLKQEQSLTI